MIKLYDAKREFVRLRQNIDKYGKDVQQRIDIALTKGAKAIELKATNYAPDHLGLLRGETFADTDKFLTKEVVSPVYYAPYMEFGTKGKFKPNGRANIAARFKGASGQGGSFSDFIKSMYIWLDRKGLWPAKATTQKAKLNYAKYRAIKIAKEGVSPANKGKGFFFRAFDELLPSIAYNIKKAIAYKK